MRWVLLCLLAACPSRPSYPSAIAVRAYVAPVDPTNFVVFYHPWSAEKDAGAKGRNGVQVLSPLDQLQIQCNVPCKVAESGYVTIESKPPPEVQTIDLVVDKQGYQPARIQLPVRGDPRPVVLVMMKADAP